MKKLVALVLSLAVMLSLVPTALASQEGWLVDEPVTITVMLDEVELTPINDNLRHFQDLAERTGITVKFLPIPTSDYQTKLNSVLGTNDFPDIIRIGSNEVTNYGPYGLFVNLNEHKDALPNFFNILEQYPVAKTTFFEGETPYAFPTINRWDKTRGSCLLVRSDIMDQLGYEPADIKTFDDFYKLLQNVKATYPEMVPFAARGTGNLSGLFYALGSYYNKSDSSYYSPQTSAWEYAPTSSETRDALEFLSKWYAEGLLDPDYATCSSSDWQQKLANGTAFSFLDNSNFAQTHLPALRQLTPEASWEVINMPANAYGYARGLFVDPHQLGRLWAINAETENLDAILKLFNFLYSEEGCSMMCLGTLNEDYYVDENGNYKATPEAIEKYTVDGQFTVTKMQTERGNNCYGSFLPYIDLLYTFAVPLEPRETWYDTVAADPAFTYPVPKPAFTEDEFLTYLDISEKAGVLATQMYDKIIMGQEPITYFDECQEEFAKMGVEEMIKIYNDAQARMN